MIWEECSLTNEELLQLTFEEVFTFHEALGMMINGEVCRFKNRRYTMYEGTFSYRRGVFTGWYPEFLTRKMIEGWWTM